MLTHLIFRWRTLLSVDDMVEDILDTLQRRGELDDTYVFFSSDNGYHLGKILTIPLDTHRPISINTLQYNDFDLNARISKPVLEFLTRSYPYQPAQLQWLPRILQFRL